jgi:hypothetical protein
VVPAPLDSAIYSVPIPGNPISWAPHPNPPPLLAPSPCNPPGIEGAEPTSILSALSPPRGPGLTNLLVPGDFFGEPALDVPPTGLLAPQQTAFFVGPCPFPRPSIADCPPFTMRQHFLYAIERGTGDLLVLDSNRMRELARLHLGQPVELAMSPDLALLAVTERASDAVVFLDIAPGSATFHQVVRRTAVGLEPRGIAWEPGNEDILVCNEGDGTVSILAADMLEVRRTLRGLERPFAVAVTPARTASASSATCTSPTSSSARVTSCSTSPARPASPAGASTTWSRARPSASWLPRRSSPIPRGSDRACGSRTAGRSTRTGTRPGSAGERSRTSCSIPRPHGMIPLEPGELPNPRGLSLRIERSIGPDQLSGRPLDLALDDLSNLGALVNYHTAFSAGRPAAVNGKNLVRDVPGVGVLATNAPRYLFVPVRTSRTGGSEVIDVIDLETGLRADTNPFQPGTQSIPAPGASRVMDYFRQ